MENTDNKNTDCVLPNHNEQRNGKIITDIGYNNGIDGNEYYNAVEIEPIIQNLQLWKI